MPRTRPGRRTMLLTAGCVVAVLVAGGFAAAANLGILGVSSDTQIGGLSAAGDLLPATSTPAGAPSAPRVTAGPTTSATATAASQTYAVDVAGTVTIASDGDHIAVTSVVANPGWTWAGDSLGADSVRVAFSAGTRLLVFDATHSADGGFAATVGESSAPAVTTPDAAAAAPVEVHERLEHEGRDDDD